MSFPTEETLLRVADPTKAIAVVPSDSTDLTNIVTKGLYVGGAGDITVIFENSSAPVLYTAVPAKTFMRGSFKRVMATGTTATLMVGHGG